jgi:hypothetical protein
MIAEASGVTELTASASIESGSCGTRVELAVTTTVRVGRGVGGGMRVAVIVGWVATGAGVGGGDAGKKSGTSERYVRRPITTSRSAAPVSHQPASTRWRRWRK